MKSLILLPILFIVAGVASPPLKGVEQVHPVTSTAQIENIDQDNIARIYCMEKIEISDCYILMSDPVCLYENNCKYRAYDGMDGSCKTRICELFSHPPADPQWVEQVRPVTTSTAQIENIDQDDVENPQLVVEYVNEIYAYMRYLEDKQSISEGYLSHVKSTIMPKMRAVLVDWLIQVHQQFNLLQETLYLTIAVLN